MNDAELRTILEGATTIAVYGASTIPGKAAHEVPGVLIDTGYTVIPVHRTATEILGQKAYGTLAEVPVPVDIVDVFRPSAEVPGVVEQAVAIGAATIWVQEGITSAEGRRIAEEAGVAYVEDNCIGDTARRLGVSIAPTER